MKNGRHYRAMEFVTIGRPTAAQVILYDCVRGALFKIDDLSAGILKVCKVCPASLEHIQAITGMGKRQVAVRTKELANMGLLRTVSANGDNSAGITTGPEVSTPLPVSHLVLHVSHKCNMQCRYCYAQGGSYGGPGSSMSIAVARSAVDFLARSCPASAECSITFFGGEPLLNFDVIKATVAYAGRAGRDRNLQFHFGMTTNGTLLTKEIWEFLQRHSFSIVVSVDGPAPVHDKNRRFRGGKTTYNCIARRLTELPIKEARVYARATLCPGNGSVQEVVKCVSTFPFLEIGVTPVAATGDEFTWTRRRAESVAREMEAAARHYLKSPQSKGCQFANLRALLEHIDRGETMPYPCGAGMGLVACSPDGTLYPCHRLVGKTELALGHVSEGIDESARRVFLEEAHVMRKARCRSCWARYVCGGGCHYRSLLSSGSLTTPDTAFCPWIRRWLKFGMSTLSRQVLYARARESCGKESASKPMIRESLP